MTMAERLEHAQTEAQLVPSRTSGSGNRTFTFTPADKDKEQGRGVGKGKGKGKGQREYGRGETSGRQGRSMRGLISEKKFDGKKKK